MKALEDRIQAALNEGPGLSSWETLIRIFNADREAFYLLASEGVASDAPPRLGELADLARRVRDAVRGSYEIVSSADTAYLAGPHGDRTFIPPNLTESVRDFLCAVDAKGIQDGSGRDYEGTPVSEAEVRFQLGEQKTWERDRRVLQDRLDAAPMILRLDPEDATHLRTQPGYVTFGLKECARRTVLAPTQVFRDLQRAERCPENLRGALAFCGQPRWAVNNQGQGVRPPDGMVFAVYADAEGFVFDWDWVQENPHEPGSPIDCRIRFGDPIELGRDAYLDIPESLPDPEFDWTKVCYSPRGDCIFCYITDDVSFACRISSDLTVFRFLDDREKIAGFKIKNVRRILEEDKNIILNDDPDLLVSLQSVLLATLKGHKDADLRVYDVLIEAFRKVAEPPMVRVPRRDAHRRELAGSRG